MATCRARSIRRQAARFTPAAGMRSIAARASGRSSAMPALRIRSPACSMTGRDGGISSLLAARSRTRVADDHPDIGNRNALLIQEHDVGGSDVEPFHDHRAIGLRLNVDDVRVADEN